MTLPPSVRALGLKLDRAIPGTVGTSTFAPPPPTVRGEMPRPARSVALFEDFLDLFARSRVQHVFLREPAFARGIHAGPHVGEPRGLVCVGINRTDEPALGGFAPVPPVHVES